MIDYLEIPDGWYWTKWKGINIVAQIYTSEQERRITFTCKDTSWRHDMNLFHYFHTIFPAITPVQETPIQDLRADKLITPEKYKLMLKIQDRIGVLSEGDQAKLRFLYESHPIIKKVIDDLVRPRGHFGVYDPEGSI